MEKIKWSERVTNEQVFEHIGKKPTVLNNILRRKANWLDIPCSRFRIGIIGDP